MSSDLPILYSFRRCPYAMRARLALSAAKTPVALREVVLRDKPEAMRQASPKATVPVLVLEDGSVIDESLDVMRWALGISDPEGWLAPLESPLKDQALALIADNDGPFKHHLDRFKYATRYEGADSIEHREAAGPYLQKLDDCLANHAFLSGHDFSFTDAAIAPFIRQFANADRTWFDSSGLDRLRAWLDDFMKSDRFTKIMGKFAQWQPGDTEPRFPES